MSREGGKGEDTGPWLRQSRDQVYDNPWISVFHDKVIDPGGKQGIYGVVHFKHVAVGVVAVDADNQILLVRQHRYPLNRSSDEIPEGGAAISELPLLAAQRELMEETGYQAENWRQILEMDLSNSITDERAVVFLATDLRKCADPNPESSESDMVLSRRPLSDLLEAIDRGEIRDAISVAALLKIQHLLSIE